MINTANAEDRDRPRGFKVHTCIRDGEDQLGNKKAQSRLQSGEVIVYADRWAFIVKVSLFCERLQGTDILIRLLTKLARKPTWSSRMHEL